jgi:Leucine-rich repeat (LRR) protein
MPISEKILRQVAENDPALTEIFLPSQYPELTSNDMQMLSDAMRNNTVIKALVFSDNKIGDEGAAILSNFPNIETVVLDSNDISDNGATAISKLSRLVFLSLCQNKISDRGLEDLLHLNKLETLRINENRLTEKSVTALLNNHKITELLIDGCGLENAMTDKLQEHIIGNRKKSLEEPSHHAKRAFF